MHGDQVEYTSEDIRFTRSKNNKILYVTFLGYPEDTTVPSLAKLDLSKLKKSTLLATHKIVRCKQSEKGLWFKLPSNLNKDDFAYVIELEFENQIPSLNKSK